MTKFFIDLHPVNQASFDFGACKPAGVTGVAVKAAEGEGINYGEAFHDMVKKVQDHGLDLFVYFWLHSGSASYQERCVQNLLGAMGELGVPIGVDFERSKVDSAKFIDFFNFKGHLEAHDREVTNLYLPRWYHQEIGSPALNGGQLDKVNLWNSAYGPDVTDSPANALERNQTQAAWQPIGGKVVDALQFGQKVMVGEWKVDCSAPSDDVAYDKIFGITNRKTAVDTAREQLLSARKALRVAETNLSTAQSNGKKVDASLTSATEARMAVRDALRALPDR